MQLAIQLHSVLTPVPQARFLCVFDGHGGSSVAEYVARTLPSTVDAELMQLSLDAASSAVESAISRAFVSLDLQLSQDMMKPEGEALRRPGSCALLAVERNGWLHVAHAGDCRAVVTYGKGEQILLATKDHNAKEAAEQIQLRTAHPGEDDVVVRSPSISRNTLVCAFS
jgi:protein phosphatase 1L